METTSLLFWGVLPAVYFWLFSWSVDFRMSSRFGIPAGTFRRPVQAHVALGIRQAISVRGVVAVGVALLLVIVASGLGLAVTWQVVVLLAPATAVFGAELESRHRAGQIISQQTLAEFFPKETSDPMRGAVVLADEHQVAVYLPSDRRTLVVSWGNVVRASFSRPGTQGE